jgi:hypothetical protein
MKNKLRFQNSHHMDTSADVSLFKMFPFPWLNDRFCLSLSYESWKRTGILSAHEPSLLHYFFVVLNILRNSLFLSISKCISLSSYNEVWLFYNRNFNVFLLQTCFPFNSSVILRFVTLASIIWFDYKHVTITIGSNDKDRHHYMLLNF